MTLTLKIEREVLPIEVVNLVWGTGALTWSWWVGASLVRYNPTQKKWLSVPSEGGDYENTVLAGDSFVFEVDDPNEAEGSGITIKKRVTLQEIVDAVLLVAKFISAEDLRDMYAEDLGYADAGEADLVLQWAVFGEGVYG